MSTTWSDPQDTTVADLKAGDFLVSYPTQDRIRGHQVGSGIRTITDPAYGTWTYGPPRRKRPVQSRTITLLDPKMPAIDLPLTHRVIARISSEDPR